MIAKVMKGGDTYRLLHYLYGPGSANEHIDPHLVGAWRELGVPDPGRGTPEALRELARRLDLFVVGRPRRHVWHCAVRVAPSDRALADPEWDTVSRSLLAAAGLAPWGDERACRWVAVRHDGSDSQHIHIVATLMRQDDQRPDIHNDALRLRDECRRLERDLDLRRTSESNRTSGKPPQRGETEKASRRELAEAPRVTLARQVRAAAVAASSLTDFFALLDTSGVLVHRRPDAAGDTDGYSVALPGDENPHGEPIWFGGGKLAPDLTLPAVRERFAGAAMDIGSTAGPREGWRRLAEAAQRAGAEFPRQHGERRAATALAVGDVLTALAEVAPSELVVAVGRAARAWEHAGRVPLPREDTRLAADLRRVGRALARQRAPEPATLRQALAELAPVLAAVHTWLREQGWHAQADAAVGARTALDQAQGPAGTSVPLPEE